MISNWLSNNFELFFVLSIVWLLGWILASVIYRKINHSGIQSPTKGIILFEEKTASGRSLKNWFSTVGGAQNCLVVTVTHTELLIRPFFPFTLMFLPEIFDLEHQTKLSSITEIERTKALFGEKILVQYANGGTTHRVELRLRNPDDFLESVQFPGGGS